jgi:hypothetical protein
MNFSSVEYNKIKEHNWDLLRTIGVNYDLKNTQPECYFYLTKYLFPRHPNYDKKVRNMVNIGIRENPVHYHLEFIIFKDDGTFDDISANYSCVYKCNRNDLHQTMKTTIQKEIKYNHRSLPAGITISELRDEFLRTYSTRVPESFDDDLVWGGTKFKGNDADFKGEWIIYCFNYSPILESMSG